jgi:MFS transporter, FHS family, L-fucose permease
MALIVNTDSRVVNSTVSKQTGKYLLPFILITSLFFLWGMAHNLNSVLIPHLKKACQLNNSQSTLIDTAVFLAYFIMAIPAGMILRRWGYKNGIILGLGVFACGAFLFVPAANTRLYELFLLALFIIGCGLTILETAANPYAAILGPPESASARLNLAASFNGLAATVAPFIGAGFILSGVEYSDVELSSMTSAERIGYLTQEASSVKMPYIILGSILLLAAVVFYFMNLPEVREEKAKKSSNLLAAFKYKHLTWAVVAQFFYVGAQVCITSFFIRMAKQGGGIDEITASYYLGIYGLLFMIGRFAGTFFLKFIAPEKLLTIYAAISILLCLVAILSQGSVVIYSLGALGLFMSIMFPTIFSMGINGLGEDTKAGSSLLVMAIVGGAVIPYIMGTLIDLNNDNIQMGYTVPLVCFVVILFFAITGSKMKSVLKG